MAQRNFLIALMALCMILCITAPVFSKGSTASYDEDEFGEYDDFESGGIAGTAMPYIPEEPVEKQAAKPSRHASSDSFDDDEFEGTSTTSIEFQPEETQTTVADFTVPASGIPAPFAYNWVVEVCAIAFLICFLVTYIVGRKANEKIASTFARTYRDLFTSEFTVVGVNGAILVKESQHTFRLNATGRSFVKGIQANLRLERRHDLVGRLYNKFWAPARDMLDIQVAMNDDALEPIVFALVKNRDARDVAKEFSDIGAYTKSVKLAQDTNNKDATLDTGVWTALAESKEITNLVLDAATRATLNKYKDHVRLIHITDQYPAHKEYKKVLHLVFYLPEIDKLEEIKTLVKLVFHMIDHTAKLSLPPALKQSIEKARSKVVTEDQKEAMEQRKEELEQEKLEKRREKMKNMDANERAEFEEKERQRKFNKRVKKISVAGK